MTGLRRHERNALREDVVDTVLTAGDGAREAFTR
jgi:hypothetical protein